MFSCCGLQDIGPLNISTRIHKVSIDKINMIYCILS
jgi:hypothetical protein